jgi:hypothetical protein
LLTPKITFIEVEPRISSIRTMRKTGRLDNVTMNVINVRNIDMPFGFDSPTML